MHPNKKIKKIKIEYEFKLSSYIFTSDPLASAKDLGDDRTPDPTNRRRSSWSRLESLDDIFAVLESECIENERWQTGSGSIERMIHDF